MAVCEYAGDSVRDMASPVFASGLVVIGFKERHVCALFASAKCGRERETTTMASPYQGTSYPGNESQGNVTSLTQSGQAAATAPEIRTIGLPRPGAPEPALFWPFLAANISVGFRY